jgi:hypothetical protein
MDGGERSFAERYVRSETGLGAEVGTKELPPEQPAPAGKTPASAM